MKISQRISVDKPKSLTVLNSFLLVCLLVLVWRLAILWNWHDYSDTIRSSYRIFCFFFLSRFKNIQSLLCNEPFKRISFLIFKYLRWAFDKRDLKFIKLNGIVHSIFGWIVSINSIMFIYIKLYQSLWCYTKVFNEIIFMFRKMFQHTLCNTWFEQMWIGRKKNKKWFLNFITSACYRQNSILKIPDKPYAEHKHYLYKNYIPFQNCKHFCAIE